MIVEIKIVKVGTEIVVAQTASFVECGRIEVAQAFVASVIESITNSELDQDDKNDIRALSEENLLSSRFGSDWEFFVEAVIVNLEDLDIDEEFDAIMDKYSFVL